VIVIVCPGQGSQTPGFLTPWLTEPRFAEHLDTLSDAAGVDLAKHGTVSDADTIRDTAIAQPLIVAAGLLTLQALLDGRRDRIGGIAGHSVGEFTAAAGAGILSDSDAVRLVAARGAAMADAATAAATGMSAVIGADEAALLERLDELGLEPANFNGGGQIVVAGDLEALERSVRHPPAGARVIPLQVAGAFHTRYMAPRSRRFAPRPSSPTPSPDPADLDEPRRQPRGRAVRHSWTCSSARCPPPCGGTRRCSPSPPQGVDGIIEIAPAGALVGLAKRALKGVPTVAIKTPDDLAAAYDLIDGNAS
jgi:[acyl-carrier-protein] S-malonyltransferase